MVAEGKLSLEIVDDIKDLRALEAMLADMPKEQLNRLGAYSNQQTAAVNIRKAEIARMQESIKTTQVLLTHIEVEQLKSMLRILQEVVTGKPISELQPAIDSSKKRVLANITQGPATQLQDTAKIRKLEQSQELAIVKTKKLSLSDLPWDTINIIFNFSQHEHYKLFRLNRTFAKLINKRRTGLQFKLAEIAPITFFNLIFSSKEQLKSLKIMVNLKFVKKSAFESNQLRLNHLQELDLSKLEMISETAMMRLLESASKTLTIFRVTVKNQGISRVSMNALSKSRQLKILEIGFPFEKIDKTPTELVPAIKSFLMKKSAKLQILKLYECDFQTLQLLANGPEEHVLEELSIIKFIQGPRNQKDVAELLPIAKLKALKSLSLCHTHFPLICQITDISEEASFSNSAISGSRELEQIFFNLKNTLKHIRLGDYIWDDFLIYIAEVCRGLEVVEFNSKKLTDAGISHLLKRAENLTALDVSLCYNFTGLAFADVDQETFKSKGLRWVKLSLLGHEQKMAQDRLKELVPACQLIFQQPVVCKN